MKLTEITNTARKIIKQMNFLYIEYSTYGKVDTFHKLWNMIESNAKSEDQDIISHTLLYKNKLTSDLIRMLRNE